MEKTTINLQKIINLQDVESSDLDTKSIEIKIDENTYVSVHYMDFPWGVSKQVTIRRHDSEPFKYRQKYTSHYEFTEGFSVERHDLVSGDFTVEVKSFLDA